VSLKHVINLVMWIRDYSFHDAIEEIALVRPQCSSFSRAALSWSLSCYDLNLPFLSLGMRVLAFSTTSVTSELEVINRLLSFVREQTHIQFVVHTLQPSRGSGIPASQNYCSFFTHFGIAALYPKGPSLCLNLFFAFSLFLSCC
jgi:hypothetical protein